MAILADGDEPGRRGAEALASVLAAYARLVKVAQPPKRIKDVRDWYRQGATRADVLALVRAAPALKLTIQVENVRDSKR